MLFIPASNESKSCLRELEQKIKCAYNSLPYPRVQPDEIVRQTKNCSPEQGLPYDEAYGRKNTAGYGMTVFYAFIKFAAPMLFDKHIVLYWMRNYNQGRKI